MEYGIVGSDTAMNLRQAEDIMVMVRAIVRPEKADAVMEALMDAGFPAVTKMGVFGRGKQRGIKIGEITYDELPKEMLMMVVPDRTRTTSSRTILQPRRTGERAATATARSSSPSRKSTRSAAVNKTTWRRSSEEA